MLRQNRRCLRQHEIDRAEDKLSICYIIHDIGITKGLNTDNECLWIAKFPDSHCDAVPPHD